MIILGIGMVILIILTYVTMIIVIILVLADTSPEVPRGVGAAFLWKLGRAKVSKTLV